MKPKKQATGTTELLTIRIETDLVEWYKRGGKGYQTRMKQVLRDHMNAQVQAGQRERSAA